MANALPSARRIRMKPPPPMPVDCGCATASAKAAAMAASTALPPARNISTPASVTTGCGLTTSARALVTGSGAAACAATATAAASRYTSARAHAATVMGSDASEALSAPAAARVPRGGGAQPEQQQRARLRRGAGRHEGVLRVHADAQVAGPERGHHVVERLALLEEEVHGDFLA